MWACTRAWAVQGEPCACGARAWRERGRGANVHACCAPHDWCCRPSALKWKAFFLGCIMSQLRGQVLATKGSPPGEPGGGVTGRAPE